MPTSPDTDWADTAGAASLLDAFVTLPDRASAERFLRDLCTRRELEEMTSRWAVVWLLADGIPYRAIREQTGVSTATITRINDWLRNGTGGYREALERLDDQERERERGRGRP